MNTAIVSALPTHDRAGITFDLVSVTPDLAQKWLGLNTSNRKLKPGQVASFASDMKAGRWLLNGEAIKLGGPAYAPTKLLDGQNRLHAVLKSGMTVQLLVVFGVPDGAQSTMDSGTKRTVADNLTIGGTQHAAITAAAAGLAIRVSDGYLTGFGGQATNSRTLEFIAENQPALSVSAALASQYAAKADVPKSIVAYTHWRLSRLNLDEATAFWRDAALKAGLPEGDPVLALTSRFAQARRQHERVIPGAAVAAIFRAWNARRAGQTLRTVALKTPVGVLPKIR